MRRKPARCGRRSTPQWVACSKRCPCTAVAASSRSRPASSTSHAATQKPQGESLPHGLAVGASASLAHACASAACEGATALRGAAQMQGDQGTCVTCLQRARPCRGGACLGRARAAARRCRGPCAALRRHSAPADACRAGRLLHPPAGAPQAEGARMQEGTRLWEVVVLVECEHDDMHAMQCRVPSQQSATWQGARQVCKCSCTSAAPSSRLSHVQVT